MSVYRIDVGITGGRCYRAVEVLWRFEESSRFTTRDRKLLLEHDLLSIRPVFICSIPRGSFHKFRVILDAAALQLNRANLTFKLDILLHGISFSSPPEHKTNMFHVQAR